MKAKRLILGYLALVMVATGSLVHSYQNQPAQVAQMECDAEAADQAWQHAYGSMSETELAAGVVLEPTGEAK
ncbi:TPA: hypothetical protein ACFP4Q_001341 [Neisseria weaveri]